MAAARMSPGDLAAFPAGDIALALGADGDIGNVVASRLSTGSVFERVMRSGRTTTPAIDLMREAKIKTTAALSAAQENGRLTVDRNPPPPR